MLTNSLARPAAVLDNDTLRRLAPSIFAETPWGRMSDRYRMIPTIEVVAMLADRGFRPVLAQPSRSRIEGKGDFTRHLIRFRHDQYLGAAAVARQESVEPTGFWGGLAGFVAAIPDHRGENLPREETPAAPNHRATFSGG